MSTGSATYFRMYIEPMSTEFNILRHTYELTSYRFATLEYVQTSDEYYCLASGLSILI